MGPYLAKHLLEAGANIYGLMRRRSTGKKPKNLVELGIYDEIDLLEGNLKDISSLSQAIQESKPDHVFHLGAQSFVPYSFTNPVEVAKVNAIGTVNLLEAIRLTQYDPSIVFAGSSEEYGLVVTSNKQYERVLEKLPK